ncbi:MAG: TlpA disulfide reductase family protein [Verrucomicrobia bacterium]|nr:TlpA disulfide reductase family protein [Verrucomicrobiota bacterium]
MKTPHFFVTCAALAAWVSSLAAALPVVRWDGKIVQGENYELAFPFEVTGDGDAVAGSFFNGDIPVSSTGGSLKDNQLQLEFAHYGNTLKATLENGVLKGSYGNEQRGFKPFEARPQVAPVPAPNAPQIGGVWTIPTESEKGEKAWSLIVRQEGGKVFAAINRIDGDTGSIDGIWTGERFALQKFDGARGYTLDITPVADGSLALALRSSATRPAAKLTALRPEVATSRGLPPPNDPLNHLRIKNPDEPFRFSFPDLNGKIVSNDDPRFQGKVVVIAVGGSWCPNCHDEAPFLKEIYAKYRALGLEVVSFSFEEAAQLPEAKRLRAYIKKYDLNFTYLLGGDRKEVNAKLPQVENLNTWPASFVLGRDGRVRATHAGFAAPATGELHQELRRDFITTIEKLLAEPAPKVTASL